MPDLVPMQADPEMVEVLVDAMTKALEQVGGFSVSDGLSAAMTFAFRYARVVGLLSPDEESRTLNVQAAARALRQMAAQLDMELGEDKETVH